MRAAGGNDPDRPKRRPGVAAATSGGLRGDRNDRQQRQTGDERRATAWIEGKATDHVTALSGTSGSW